MQSLVITSGECLQSGTLADGQCAFLGVGEEVIALVVNDDEGGEVFYLNLPYCFHTEFGVLQYLYLLNAVLGENSCGATNGAQVEAAVLLASIGDLLGAVALEVRQP